MENVVMNVVNMDKSINAFENVRREQKRLK